MTWDTSTLAQLRDDQEIELIVSAEGKGDLRFPVWVVVVGGEAYVRSYLGATALWFRRVTQQPSGAIVVAGAEVATRFEPDSDAQIAPAIDRAFTKKYDGDPYAGAMIADEVATTTLRLVPLD